MHILESWTKLFVTKVEDPVNSRNGSIFLIENSPPYPRTSMLNVVKFCCQKLETLQRTLIWGAGEFLLKNKFFILSQQFCPRLEVIDIFIKIRPKLLNGIEIHVGALYPLNSIKSNL